MRRKVRGTIAKHEELIKKNKFSSLLANWSNLSAVTPIYHAVLSDPSVPSDEKCHARLEDDALFLMMASTDAPSQALAITMFHILNTRSVYNTLREELFSAIPKLVTPLTLEALEPLPYLASLLFSYVLD